MGDFPFILGDLPDSLPRQLMQYYREYCSTSSFLGRFSTQRRLLHLGPAFSLISVNMSEVTWIACQTLLCVW